MVPLILDFYNARHMRLALYALVIVLTVVAISVVLDMQSPGDDFDHGSGCHIDWFGVVPIGRYCVFP